MSTALRTDKSSLNVEFEAQKKEYSDRDHPDIQRFKSQVLKATEQASEGEVLYFSLDEARLSSSCFDETIGEAIEKVAARRANKLPDRFIVAVDPEGENWWDADAALRKASSEINAKLVCVWRGPEGATRIIGPADDKARATYEFVSRCGGEGATTRDLSEARDISIQAASNRMSRTARIGLIRRVKQESVSRGGTQHVYLAVE